MRIALWGIWLCVLLSVFCFPENDSDAPSYVYSYAYLSLGMLAALGFHPLLLKKARSEHFGLIGYMTLVFGVVIFLLLLALDVTDEVGFSIQPLMVLSALTSIRRLLFCLEGYACMAVGFHLSKCGSSSSGADKSENPPTPLVAAFAVMCLLLFAAGNCRLGQCAVVLSEFCPSGNIGWTVSWIVSMAFVVPVAVSISYFVQDGVSLLSGSTQSSLFQLAAGSFVCGRLTWALVSHAFGDARVMTLASAPVAVIFGVCDIAILICLYIFRQKMSYRFEFDNSEADEKDIRFKHLEEMISAHNLTPREAEAIRHCCEGLSSKESGELMGLKPSTVRAYLQRAYKKLGVDDASGLESMLDSATASDDLENDSKLGAGNKRERSTVISRRAAFCCILSLFCLSMLPYSYAETLEIWHFNHATVVGFGLGFLASAVVSVFRKLLVKESIFPRFNHRVAWHVGIGMVATLGCTQLALARFVYFATFAQVDYGTGILLVGTSSLLFSLSAISLGSLMINATRAVERGKGDPLLVLSGLLLLFLSKLSFTWWLIACLAESVLSGVVCVATLCQRTSRIDEPGEGGTLLSITPPLKIAILGAAASMYFALGEQWHSDRSPFMITIQMMFSLGIALFVVWRGRDVFRKCRGITTTLVIAVVICSILGNLSQGVLVLSFGLFCIFVSKTMGDSVSAWTPLWLTGSGFGMSLGRLLIDRWGELTSLPQSFFDVQSDFSMIMFVTPTVVVLVLVFGFMCMKTLVDTCMALSQERVIGTDVLRLQVLYLESQGLSESKAAILSRVVQGLTNKQVAEQMHYSVGYVNSVCDEGYKLLGVHTRQEFRDALCHAVKHD